MLRFLLGVFIMSSVAFCSVLPKYESKKLSNGLEVVVIPMRNNSNVIQTNVFYKVGSRNEVMGKSGIAHMLEHMNFKSTKNLKAGEFDEIVKKMGGIDNASTSFDYTHYFIKSSSNNLDKSLELFAELMENLNLQDSEFQSERDVVAQERLWRTDNNPGGYLFFRFFNTAFVYHSYHWTPIGFMNDIQTWSIDDIRDFHAKYYQPQNAILLVSGDISSDEVFSKVQKYFSHIKNTQQIPELHIKEPKQDGARRTYVKKDTGGIEWVAIGFRTPSFDNKDQVALEAISDIMAGTKSSILPTLLQDKLKIASSVSTYNMGMIDDGIFFIIATGNAGVSASEIEREILKEIENLKEGNISQDMLDKVKINTKYQFIHSLESSSTLASLYGSYLVRGDIKPLIHYEENLENLSIKDIKEVAKKYFVEDNSTTVIMKGE